jgi:hypothetical protein
MTLPCLGMRTAYAVPFPRAEAVRSCLQLRRSLQVDRLDQFRPLLGSMIGARSYSCLGMRTAYAVPFPLAEAARSCLQLRRSLQVDRLDQFRPLLGPMIGARSYSLLSCGSLPLFASRVCNWHKLRSAVYSCAGYCELGAIFNI